ncbi:MAG: hypothetical protein IJS28_03175, partial [Synergistaceae bacterium]|nr:hypothetical protein [Synergistaceae bacterium]
MKKYLALLAAVLVFAFAGMAFAADTNAPTSGHGGSQPVADPDSGNTGSAGATEVTEVVVETKAPVQVVVVAAAVATVASAEDVKVTVVQAVLNAISNAISSILEALGITGGSTEVKGADNIEVNEEEAYASDEEAMEQSAARLENNGVTGQTAVAALPRGMAVKESGTQPVSLPKFKKEMYGKRPQMNMFPRGRARNAEFAAAADGDGDAVFLDSTGAQVNVIPGEDNANGAEPGQLTAVVYMEAGETYDPVISVPTEEITSDTALANQVTTKAVAEEVITTQTFMATSTFSTFVPSALLEGTNYVTIPADAVSAAGWEDTAAEKAYKEADASFDVYTVAALPAIAAPAAPTWYIAAVSFDRGTKTASDLYTGAALEFFPSN